MNKEKSGQWGATRRCWDRKHGLGASPALCDQDIDFVEKLHKLQTIDFSALKPRLRPGPEIDV